MTLCFTCAMVIGAFIVATEREKNSSHNVSPWGLKDRLKPLCLIVNKLIGTMAPGRKGEKNVSLMSCEDRQVCHHTTGVHKEVVIKINNQTVSLNYLTNSTNALSKGKREYNLFFPKRITYLPLE